MFPQSLVILALSFREAQNFGKKNILHFALPLSAALNPKAPHKQNENTEASIKVLTPLALTYALWCLLYLIKTFAARRRNNLLASSYFALKQPQICQKAVSWISHSVLRHFGSHWQINTFKQLLFKACQQYLSAAQFPLLHRVIREEFP